MNELPQWTRQAQDLLDESAQHLDGATLSRLNRARQAALMQRGKKTARRSMLAAGLAGACAMLLALAVWQGRFDAPPARGVADASGAAVAAADADAPADDEDFYEDLDFYAWLDAQDQDPEG